ncbi:MAG: hypothetical protein JST80_05705 [Bdellovibrionales bacterium]|nr:hypothetical protein [Bdellovibrionales bacterium]
MKRSGLRLRVFISLVLLMAPCAEAKELVGRLGLGYNAQFANTQQVNGVPAISIKYGVAPRAMIEAIGGFYSGSNGTGVAALKYMYTVHAESYANFYFLFGGGYVSANHQNGTEFVGGLGCEFFIPGVDSVGLSFETGMSIESLTSGTGSFVLKTFGVSFINAGMHFYF